MISYLKWFLYKRFVYAYYAKRMPPHMKTRSVLLYSSKHYVKPLKIKLVKPVRSEQ